MIPCTNIKHKHKSKICHQIDRFGNLILNEQFKPLWNILYDFPLTGNSMEEPGTLVTYLVPTFKQSNIEWINQIGEQRRKRIHYEEPKTYLVRYKKS